MPKLDDWSLKTESRPVQQIIYFYCMQMLVKMSNGLILPTKKFLAYVDKRKPYKIITGCIDVKYRNDDIRTKKSSDKIYILFSGKIEFEHGINKLVDAITLMDKQLTFYKNIKI